MYFQEEEVVPVKDNKRAKRIKDKQKKRSKKVSKDELFEKRWK